MMAFGLIWFRYLALAFVCRIGVRLSVIWPGRCWEGQSLHHLDFRPPPQWGRQFMSLL